MNSLLNTPYLCSLCAVVCGVFVSRWVLAAVRKSEFGLYGVVGGMTVIVVVACGRIAVAMRRAPQKWYASDRHERKTAHALRGEIVTSEVFGCIPHGREAYRLQPCRRCRSKQGEATISISSFSFTKGVMKC